MSWEAVITCSNHNHHLREWKHTPSANRSLGMSKGGGLQAFDQAGWITKCLQWTCPFSAESGGLLRSQAVLRFVDGNCMQCLESAWFPWLMLLSTWIFLFKGILRAVTAPWGRTWSTAPALKCKSGLNWVSQCWAGAPGTSHLLQLVMYANFGTFEAKSPGDFLFLFFNFFSLSSCCYQYWFWYLSI